MGQVGSWQIVSLVVGLVLPFICFWRILPRAGFPSWMALVSVIPLGTFILLLVLAFRKWPGNDNQRAFD